MGHQVHALKELNTASTEVANSVVETNKVSESVATQGAQLAQQVDTLKALADGLNAIVSVQNAAK